ncbi:MAG TPA: universal stress protein [Polyangiales bacterium]
MTKIRKIVCPVDFSAGSDRAIDYALDFARALDAEVWLVHVYELPLATVPTGVARDAAEPGQLFDFIRDVKGHLSTQLSELVAKHRGAGNKLHARLVEGAPAGGIVEFAKELAADLVIMGTHGRTGLAHLMLGSVAERVVRSASCPVLTVPIVS